MMAIPEIGWLGPDEWQWIFWGGLTLVVGSGLGLVSNISWVADRLPNRLRCLVLVRPTQRQQVRLKDALYWIIDNSGWNMRLGREAYAEQAAIDLRQRARNGEITILGRRKFPKNNPDGQFDKTWDDIEQDYWVNHDFELVTIVGSGPNYAISETRLTSDTKAGQPPCYAMLRVWRDELKRQWPKTNI